MKHIRMIAAVLTVLMLTGCGTVPEFTPAHKKQADSASEAVSVPDNADSGEYIYCVGSVSKIYVTAAVMQLVDAGQVGLDTPVTEYIPGFRMADQRYRDITVRMLMDHTSGIMGTVHDNDDLYDDNSTEHHDRMLDHLAKQRLRNDPGKYAAYCNDGFVLLEMIVENVTGMSYTDYVRTHISDKIGVTDTGTALDLFRNEKLVPSVSASGHPLDTCYCMEFGGGGIYATASDTAKLGAAFFTGDTTLISDSAKQAMATRWNDNEYSDGNGLGWDDAEMPRYQQNGVKVVGKGGDVTMDHAYLLTAPDEHISVAVLSNGGSSTYNDLVAQTLMDVVLEEKGIAVNDSEAPECTVVEDIPEDDTQYAGWYVMSAGNGDTLCRVTFPDHKYLHMEKITSRRTTCADYVYTADGDFAELAYEVAESGFDKRLLAWGSHRLSFEKNADGVFIRESGSLMYPGLGTYSRKTYTAQMLDETDADRKVPDSIRALDGQELLFVGDKYSSEAYESVAVVKLSLIDQLDGYLFCTGHGADFLLKIQDGEHLVSPKNIPSSSSRDILDVQISTDGNGSPVIVTSAGQHFIPAAGIPAFDTSVKSVEMTESAKWYSISDSIANTPVTVTRPENSAVIVFNKFDEVIYTSHNRDAGKVLPMPKDGKVVFLGQKGDTFAITV